MRSLDPDAHLTQDSILLREAEHSLRVLAWLKTKDATKTTPQNYPQQYPITATELAKAAAERAKTETEKPDAMTFEEAREFLGW